MTTSFALGLLFLAAFVGLLLLGELIAPSACSPGQPCP
jgi:hypothetical protein